MGQLYSYFFEWETPTPNAEDVGTESELNLAQNGSGEKDGPADQDIHPTDVPGIGVEKRNSFSAEGTVSEDGDSRPSPVPAWSPGTGSETERGPSPNTMSPMNTTEKINIRVKAGTNTVEVEMFPMESVSVLLMESCQRLGRNPARMSLIYDGEKMEEKKRMWQYNLRGGAKVSLIRAA